VIAMGLLLYIYFHPGVRILRTAAPAEEAGAGESTGDVVALDERRARRHG
jgi:hypothetical protein